MEVDLEKDYYAILRVPESAPREEILRAHREVMRIIHPDKHLGDRVALEWATDANIARDLLTDPIQRAEYDRGRRALRGGSHRGDRTQTHKVHLTPEQAGLGGRVSWLEYLPNGSPVLRRIDIPAGVKNGDEFSCPKSLVDGQLLPEVTVLVLVDGPEPRTTPSPPRSATASPKDSPSESDPAASRSPAAPPSTGGRPGSRRLLGSAAALGAVGVVAWVLLAGPLGSGAEGGTPTVGQPTEAAPTASGIPKVAAEDPIASTVAPPSDEPGAEPAVVLDAWVVESKPVVRTLPVGAWVPQVSSKCSGLTSVDLRDPSGRLGYPDGSPEDFPSGITETDILNFNLGLAERLDNAMLLVRGTAPPICDGPRLWASLSTVIAESRDAVTAWCSTNGFPPGECAPREITDALVEDATYVVYSAPDARYSVEVPWSMDPTSVGDITQFSDSESGATFRILTTQYPIGSTPDQRLGEASDLLVPPGTQPTLAEVTDSGFALSGITADGEIYYWRQIGGDAGGLDLIWKYPTSARETFDDAVQRSVDRLEFPDD